MTLCVISERSLQDGAAAGELKFQVLCTEYCFTEVLIFLYDKLGLQAYSGNTKTLKCYQLTLVLTFN